MLIIILCILLRLCLFFIFFLVGRRYGRGLRISIIRSWVCLVNWLMVVLRFISIWLLVIGVVCLVVMMVLRVIRSVFMLRVVFLVFFFFM